MTTDYDPGVAATDTRRDGGTEYVPTACATA
jgi:hypothetical protein